MIVRISPYKSFYKAALTVSFDYETSAISQPLEWWVRLYHLYLKKTNRLRTNKKKLSYGENQREGAELILKALNEHDLHATWFATGHTLLKGNTGRNEYRINHTLISDPHRNRWRERIRTFDDDPFSTFHKRPDYYFGDLTEKLFRNGEDIQCHTFSHSFLALESPGNISTDLQDWQNAAQRNGFPRATVLAFPFLSDCFYYYPDSDQSLAYQKTGEKWELRPISPERLHLIRDSGIELLTRCGSRTGEPPFSSFRRYNDSGLFYMSNRALELKTFSNKKFEEDLKEIIDNEWLIDYWCHPHNIAEHPYRHFLDFLSTIKKYLQSGQLWVATIREAWEHYSLVGNIDLIVVPGESGSFQVILRNKNKAELTETGIDIDLEKYRVESRDDLLVHEQNHKKVVIKKIRPESEFIFTIQTKR